MERNTRNKEYRCSYPNYLPKWFRYIDVDSEGKSFIIPNAPKDMYRNYRRYRIKTGFEINVFHAIIKNEFFRVWRDTIIPAPTKLEVIAYKTAKLAFPLNFFGLFFINPVIFIEEKRLGL